MNITISVTVADGETVDDVLDAIRKMAIASGEAPAAAEPKETAAEAKKRKASEKAAQKEAAKEEEEAKPEGPTREEVRTKLKDHAALEGKDAAIKILKDHGSSSIGELDEDRFADVIAACDA